MGRVGVSDEMEGVTNGKVLVIGGVEVQFPISGPAGADALGLLENIMEVSEEAVC